MSLESIRLTYKRLLSEVSLESYRYLYHQFNLKNRLVGLIGARGVGKTTLLLQFIHNYFPDGEGAFYFSADHFYFNQTRLYHFIEELYLTEGIQNFFIDEIHKYPDWNQELKNLYDGFPSIKIVFSGSSSLDLIKGSYDLSRRAKLYHLPGLSFREYLNFYTPNNIAAITFDDLLSNYQQYDSLLASIPKLKGHFKAYLQNGYYPFKKEDALSYHEKILSVIEKTIYEDIAGFYNLKTDNLHYLKKLLVFLSSIPPGAVSVHNLAKNLSLDDKTVLSYLHYLEATGLVRTVYTSGKGNATLRRPEKIFLNNTNLQYALEGRLTSTIEVGSVRELFFIQSLNNAGQTVFHHNPGDYKINDWLFEIGGKNKTKAQIKGASNALLVKDDVLVSQRGVIPLVLFGFLY